LGQYYLYHEFYKWTWTAVLKRAIKDLSSPSSRIRKSALRWFLSDEIDINTFRGVCFTLDYNADDFREKLFKKYGIDKTAFRSLEKKSTLKAWVGKTKLEKKRLKKRKKK